MKADEKDCSVIRQMLTESVGQGRDISLKEAAALTGIGWRNLYAIAQGQTKNAVMHLPALLNIPPFAERYMAAKGYACTHVANEKGCEWEACESLMVAVGDTGPIVCDGIIDHRERHRLAKEVFLRPVRKMVAYMHRFRKQEVAAQ